MKGHEGCAQHGRHVRGVLGFIRPGMNRLLALLGLLTLAFGRAEARPPVPTGQPQAKLFIDRAPTRQEVGRLDTHAKYEPAVGCYLGAFIDFDGRLHDPVWYGGHSHQNPAAFESQVGKSHAMYFFYMGYGRPLPVPWVRWLGAHGKFVHIALEPNDGMDKVSDDAYLRGLADDMARSGARIFLRFASEMNGDWTAYHWKPALYRQKFRLVHDLMRRRAPNVAMVWCPYMSPTDNIAEYYPGDDGTDWVGINLYSVTYHNNKRTEPGETEHPCDLLDFVYRHYAARRPMMVCEFAATHQAACDDNPRPDFACRKILTLYTALPRLYPRVKCINYFDSNNLNFVGGNGYNDYSVTDDNEVNAAYRDAIASPYFLDRPLVGNLEATSRQIPMPLRAGDRLRGVVHLSCWARSPSDFVGVRYRLDGTLFYQADRPGRWSCTLDTARFAPGKHLLSLEALHPNGKRAAFQSFPVMITR